MFLVKFSAQVLDVVLDMVLDVVLDNSTQLADNQYWVLDKRINSFFR